MTGTAQDTEPATTDYQGRAAQLTRSEQAAMTAGRNGWSTHAHPAAGIGELAMNDGPLGLVSRGMDERETSTLLPSPTTLAATWDPELVFRIGQLIGAEARDTDTHALLGPNLGPASDAAVRPQLRDVLRGSLADRRFRRRIRLRGAKPGRRAPASNTWSATTPRPNARR